MTIKETLFALSRADAVGNVYDASTLAEKLLGEYCKTQKMNNLTVIGYLKGESDYTLMLDAHIDQISLVVTAIDDNGFLTVANAGGFDLRALPSRRVIIYGKQKITGVFCAVPPHLSRGEDVPDDISKMKIDTALGERAKDIISLGDYVTFAAEPKNLLGTKVTGKSFDDRAAVAIILEIAKRLKGEKLPFNVAFVLSDGEEIGQRGATTAAYKVNPDEAIVLDVSFGDAVGISDTECGKLGQGGMIGISPILDRKVSSKLINVAKENKIPYQLEVMGGKTSTDADVISISREGVRCTTVSIPLRNMHSDCEILDTKDLESIVELVCKYILSGGVMND